MRVPPPAPDSFMRGHSWRLKCSNRASASAGVRDGVPGQQARVSNCLRGVGTLAGLHATANA